MKKGHFFGKALALCCLAFVLVLAGCDNPTHPTCGGGGHVPGWSGPHPLATLGDLDWRFDVAFGNGTFFVLGGWDSQGNQEVRTSTDGINWTSATYRFSAFDWLDRRFWRS